MDRIRFLLGTGWLLLGLSPALAGDVEVPDMQSLIGAYGKPALVEILLDARNGQMSIQQGGRIQQVWGRPRLDLVTARSLAHDVNRAGMELQELRDDLERNAALRQDTAQSGGAPSAAIPLANLDGALRVWSPSRTWTVKQLIEDADRFQRGLPRDFNALRQKEAYRRNRRVENILLSWESSYGSADFREAERFLLRRARDRLYDCRGLSKRRNKREWDEKDCDTATRPGATRVSVRLKAQLRKPFDDFDAAMKPAMESLR